MRRIFTHRSVGLIAWSLLVWPGMVLAQLTSLSPTPNAVSTPAATSAPDKRGLLIARDANEYSYATLKPARYQGRLGLAVVFTGTYGLHYYADPNTSSGYNLKLIVQSDPNRFALPVFPTPDPYYEPAYKENIRVYEGDFTVFLPLQAQNNPPGPSSLSVMVDAMACTRRACLAPFQRVVTSTIDFSQPVELSVLKTPNPSVSPQSHTVATSPAGPGTATWLKLLLAIVAGLSINIMPCVLPVIPLIIMRLIGKSQDHPGQRLRSGLAFCVGILLFFVAFAVIYSITKISTQQAINPNDLYRSPNAVMGLFLFIVFFALAMLDIVPLTLPSAVAGHQSDSSTLTGSVGMGFFAAVLSIPCSGALLASTWAWAYTQPLLIGNTAIALMGVGMALPYAIIVSSPKLMDRIPKPGTWMEWFKKSCGFLLLLIAVKLTLAGLPRERLINLLLYGVIFSFCVWIWGQWVNFNTPRARRFGVRGVAVLIAVLTGAWLLPAPPQEQQLDWHPYDAAAIQQARDQGQAVLIKFTADWCTNCKVLERRVFEDPEVIGWIQQKHIYMVKADTTLKGPRYPATAALSEIYGQAGTVPFTVVWLPDGSRHDLPGMFSKQELKDVLDKLE